LRTKAQAAGNLRDTDEQRVTVGDGAIMIEPAQPEVIYVPAYDPTLVYGPWWYPAFPPFFFLPPPRVVVFGRIGFWTGVRVGRAWGHGWGHWDWRNHYVNVNVNRHININRNVSISRTSIQTTRWQPDVRHRKGVPYRSEASRERYGQSLRGSETRRDFRGFEQGTGYQKVSGIPSKSPPVTKTQQAPGVIQQTPPVTKSQRAPGVTQQTPPITKTQQAPVVTQQTPPITKTQQAPVVTQQTPPVTKSQLPSGPTSQVSGKRIETGTLDQQRLDRSSNRTAFGNTERGNDVRKDSNRGQQSLQDMSSKGKSSVDHGNIGRER